MTLPRFSQPLHGAFLLDKPHGISSTGALNQMKGMLGRYGYRGRSLPKMGHGGTLDPFATGLLVVLMGHGTSLASHRLKDDKLYRGTIVFGEKTPSGDRETEVCERGVVPSFVEVRKWAEAMEGEYFQVPPMYSAKKVDGQRLYKLARRGEEIEREALPCHLHRFRVFEGASPELVDFEVKCSAGTFIRTLAEDLAEKLGTVAHLRSLRRIACGEIGYQGSLTLEGFQELTDKGEDWTLSSAFISLDELLRDWPKQEVGGESERLLFHGRQDVLQSLLFPCQEERVALVGKVGPVGLAQRRGETWEFLRIFSPTNGS